MARTLYQKFRDLWKDKPDKTTPVTAEALNHFEQGIYDNSQNMALKEIYDDTAISMGRKSGTTSGINSYAVGYNVQANGAYSHAEGYETIASSSYQHVSGIYNKPDSNHLFQIGNGSSESTRSNAFYVDYNGNAWFAGGVESVGKRMSYNASTSGKILTVTFTLDGNANSGVLNAGGSYDGVIQIFSIPFFISADFSITKYLNGNVTEIEGIVKLINSNPASASYYGDAYIGNIDVTNMLQNSADTCSANVKITFDLSKMQTDNISITSSNFYKRSDYYYPIARLRKDMTEMIDALEQRIAELEREG